MARGHLKYVIQDKNGSAIQNAAVYVYQPGTTIPPGGSMYNARTGGSVVTSPLISNAQGEVEAWITIPQTVDLKITDNGDLAHLSNSPGNRVRFDDFIETTEVTPAPEDMVLMGLIGVTELTDSMVPATIMRDSEHTSASHQPGGPADLTGSFAALGSANTFSELQTLTAGLRVGPTPATTGAIRLSSAQWITSRNPGDTADLNMLRTNSGGWLEPGTRIYMDEGNEFSERNAMAAFRKVMPGAPGSLQVHPVVHLMNLPIGNGGGATFEGGAGLAVVMRDPPSVVANPATRGVMYGLHVQMQTQVPRNNVPYDDVVGCLVGNQGPGKGTDAFYITAGNPVGREWITGFLCDADVDTVFRAGAVDVDTGLDLGLLTGVALSTIRMPNNKVGLTGRNAAGTGIVEIARVDGSDRVSLRNGAVWIDDSNLVHVGAIGSGAQLFAQTTDAGRTVLRLHGAAGQTANLQEWRANDGTELIIVDENGKIGIRKSNPVNAFLYIGSGAGTLPDSTGGGMGLKVNIDSSAATRPDGIQSNVNMVSGATANGQVRGVLTRVDVRDAASTGDTVALWGDTFVRAASARDTWGTNTYVQVEPGTNYAGTAVGLEAAVDNRDLPNVGGAMHAVNKGTSSIRFGLKINSDNTGAMETGILMPTSGEGGTGPTVKLIWCGPVNANNTLAGTPVFDLDVNGAMRTVLSSIAAVGHSIQGAAGQTGNLFETKTSGGVVNTHVPAGGGLATGAGTTLGFFGATPVAQQAAIADAAGGATVDTEARAAINALLARARTYGLIAA